MKLDLDFLRTVVLFSDLPDEELQIVSDIFKETKYQRGQIVFFEEDTGKYMYIVKSGRVKVSRLLPTGKEMILAFHQSGEYFGEMALIDGETTPATVTAVVPSVILFTGSREFSGLMEHPTINRTILKTLCGRCRDAWRQIEVLNFYNAEARIRTALYHLSLNKGIKTSSGIRIDLKLTHRELAELTGISRETATRVISQLQGDRIVQVKQRQFLILDPDKLLEGLLE